MSIKLDEFVCLYLSANLFNKILVYKVKYPQIEKTHKIIEEDIFNAFIDYSGRIYTLLSVTTRTDEPMMALITLLSHSVNNINKETLALKKNYSKLMALLYSPCQDAKKTAFHLLSCVIAEYIQTVSLKIEMRGSLEDITEEKLPNQLTERLLIQPKVVLNLTLGC